MRSPLRRNSLARIRGNVFRSGARLQWWPRPKWRPSAAAGPTASGSITLGGTATAVASAPSTTGTITLGGSGTGAASPAASGSITLGGSATASARPTATGSITLGGSATGTVPAKFATLVDGFPTTIDSKWTSSDAAVSTGRVLLFAVPSPNYAYVLTALPYDLTGSLVSAKVAATAETATETLLLLTPDDITQNAAMFSVLNGSLRFRKRVSGVDTDLVTAITYSSTTHRYMRFIESAGAIVFQTSPDTGTWTTQASWTPTWALGALYLEYAAQSPFSTSAPTLDDVNLIQATAAGSITLGGAGTPTARATATGSITLTGTGTATQPGSSAAGLIVLGGTPTAAVPATTAGLITLSGLATAQAVEALSHIPGVATLSRAEATAILGGNGVSTATLAYQAGTAVLTANAGTAVLTYQPGTADLIPAAASAHVNTT